MVVLELATAIYALTHIVYDCVFIVVTLDNGAVDTLYPFRDILCVGTVKNANAVKSIYYECVIRCVMNQLKSLYLETVYLDHSIQELTIFVVVANIFVCKCGYSAIDTMNNALGVVGVMIMGSQRKRDACEVIVKPMKNLLPRQTHIKHNALTTSIID
jgi:hypothetical protein